MEVERAFALVFNARTDNEGIYSRRTGTEGVDVVLCFEEKDDAERYAMMLTAQVGSGLMICAHDQRKDTS